jgi:NAD+ synthase
MKTSLPSINVKKTANEIQSFIREVCKEEKTDNILIGVSGGVDSATCATLAVRALGKESVYPVLLPYGKLNIQGEKDSWSLIKWLKIPKNHVNTINIKSMTDSVINYDSTMDDIRKGNIMARMRMIVLYDLSRKNNLLVLGTENKTEHYLGYYTRFGDEASDIEPIRELYKAYVYHLAKYLDIPEQILKKPPTAGLWEGQTDEKEFGFSYKDADTVLHLYLDRKYSKDKIIALGYNQVVVEKIWYWVKKGELKDRLPHFLALS